MDDVQFLALLQPAQRPRQPDADADVEERDGEGGNGEDGLPDEGQEVLALGRHDVEAAQALHQEQQQRGYGEQRQCIGDEQPREIPRETSHDLEMPANPGLPDLPLSVGACDPRGSCGCSVPLLRQPPSAASSEVLRD